MEKQNDGSDNAVTDSARLVVADILKVSPDEIRTEVVSGGFSRNRRSLVGNGDNWVFVKEVDTELLPTDGEDELWWLKKDYLCTETLRKSVPHLVPEWSRLEANEHALIMASYRTSDGWLWSPPEDPELQKHYIQAVVDATKELETVQFDDATIDALKLQPYFRDKLALDDGLILIAQNEAIRSRLKDKYVNLISDQPGHLRRQHEQMVALLDDESALRSIASKAAQLIEQPNDCFGHCDVRSDNLAFNPTTGALKFVDWNWASFASKGFGATEFLVDMARRGADVTPWVDAMNIEMLAALVGFYAKRCLDDPLAPGNTLRDMQAESAAVALDLYNFAVGSRSPR